MRGNWLLVLIVIFPMISGGLIWLLGKKSIRAMNIALAAAYVCFAALTALSIRTCGRMGESCALTEACTFGLAFRLDGFRRVYLAVIALMWLVTGIFSIEYLQHEGHQARFHVFSMLTLGALCGMFLADDLMTAFIFFEVMSFTSYVWVAQEETEGALRAANTYLAIAVIGGLAALMGLLILYNRLGTLSFHELYSAAQGCGDKAALYAAGGCLLFGFGAKAGMFPLHIWLPKAHPVAPAPASALLSGVLTKAGIFGIVAVSVNIFRYDAGWGNALLIPGVITMTLGAVMALLSVDLKRALACSSMSQIGFVLVGVATAQMLGADNALAMGGAAAHMVNHSLFKLILFTCAGVVTMNTHALNLNDIRGFGRNKPVLKLAFLSGALGIMGIPLFSGYASKTLLHEGIVQAAERASTAGGSAFLLRGTEWLFLISGGLTIAYMAKLYVVLFIQEHPTKQKQWNACGSGMSLRSQLLLSLCAALPLLFGMLPKVFINGICKLCSDFTLAAEIPVSFGYFSLGNLQGAGISLAIGCAVYLAGNKFLVREGRYVNIVPDGLDLENAVYRPLLLKVLPGAFGWISAVFGENKLLRPVCAFVMSGAAVVSRAFCDMTDGLILLLRKTIFQEAKPSNTDALEDKPVYRFALFLDRIHGQREGVSVDRYAKRFLRIEQTVVQTGRKITGGLSFALLMACIGICFVFIFLLVIL